MSTAVAGWLARWAGLPLVLGARMLGTTKDPQAIVVLGAPLTASGELGAVLTERVDAGIALWRLGVAPLLLMSGGRAPRSRQRCSEAETMAAYALAAGIPAAVLVVEDRSSNTSRNAFASAALLRTRGVQRVIVVSQPFHLARALVWFRRAGLDARGHEIVGGLQAQDPARTLRWLAREYLSLLRDLTVSRRTRGAVRASRVPRARAHRR